MALPNFVEKSGWRLMKMALVHWPHHSPLIYDHGARAIKRKCCITRVYEDFKRSKRLRIINDGKLVIPGAPFE
jgi:hypothetical protein